MTATNGVSVLPAILRAPRTWAAGAGQSTHTAPAMSATNTAAVSASCHRGRPAGASCGPGSTSSPGVSERPAGLTNALGEARLDDPVVLRTPDGAMPWPLLAAPDGAPATSARSAGCECDEACSSGEPPASSRYN